MSKQPNFSYTCWFCKQLFGANPDVAKACWGACVQCSKAKLRKMWKRGLSSSCIVPERLRAIILAKRRAKGDNNEQGA